MNSSTLLVSLEGIKVGSFKEVVQARGIDRVIVVTDSASFSDSAISTTVSAVSAVKNYTPSVELALNTGTELEISDTTLQSLNSAGIGFLNDPGLSSITGALIAQTSLLTTAGSTAKFNSFNSRTNTEEQLTLEDGLTINKKTFGNKLNISISGSETPDFVSDLSASIRVNLTAQEFGEIVANSSISTNITDYSNLDVEKQTIP